MEAWEAAKNALESVLGAKKGEAIAIFCDEEKKAVGEAFSVGALKLELKTTLVELKVPEGTFRSDVPPELTEIMTKNPPHIYINLLKGIREETPFRIELIKLETASHKSRLGHCPGVTLDMLTRGALALSSAEHGQMQAFSDKLIGTLKDTMKLSVTNPAGTNFSLGVENRPFFTDTKLDWETLKWMNLPTGEVIVAPVEDSMDGSFVCDMAIGGMGPLKESVQLTVEKGKVRDSAGKDRNVMERLRASLRTDEKSSIVGEFAFGINGKARFVEEFLESEKILGTIHIAFGNNTDMPGGQNSSRNHMDLLVSKPTVIAHKRNGSSLKVLVDGIFQKS